MADEKEKSQDLAVLEAQDGSATVDLPEDLQALDVQVDEAPENQAEGGSVEENHAAEDLEDKETDDEELRQAKRNRRRAKKELIRKTNQEKDLRLQQLQRENEQFRQRLTQLERNTKAEQVTRLEKGIEDANVRLEYAKMKLAEATQNGDGQAMVEAQQLWQEANDTVRQLNGLKNRAAQELERPQQQAPAMDPEVQRHATAWMRRNSWYNPQANDTDSRVAKKVDELLMAQGWNPSDPDYWDELDARLQKELPHRYNDRHEDNSVRKPRNVVGSSGREASAAFGGSNRSQFVLSPERVRAMKEAGAWDNPERKKRMIKNFIEFDRAAGRRN